MTFQEFIKKCSSVIDEERLYFEHHYSHHDGMDFVNSYKCQIRGTDYKLFTDPDMNICQFYRNKTDFENCRDFNEALSKLIKAAKQ